MRLLLLMAKIRKYINFWKPYLTRSFYVRITHRCIPLLVASSPLLDYFPSYDLAGASHRPSEYRLVFPSSRDLCSSDLTGRSYPWISITYLSWSRPLFYRSLTPNFVTPFLLAKVCVFFLVILMFVIWFSTIKTFSSSTFADIMLMWFEFPFLLFACLGTDLTPGDELENLFNIFILIYSRCPYLRLLHIDVFL